jgi:hypothetical protein
MQQSNHTLASISLDGGLYNQNQVPLDIYCILHMNQNKNKHAVIWTKILRNHNLNEVNFVPTSLPIVFAWLGGAHVDQKLGLSQLFRILRTVPHMIRTKVDETRGVKLDDITYR